MNINEFLEHAEREAKYLEEAGRGPQAAVLLTLSEMVGSVLQLADDMERRTVTPAGFYPAANAAAAELEWAQEVHAEEIRDTVNEALENRNQ